MNNNRIFYQDNYDDDPNNEIGLDSINSQKEGTYSSSANGVFTGSLLESFFTNNDVSGVPSPAFVIGEKPGDIVEGKGVVPVEPGPGPGPGPEPGPDLPPNNEIWYTSSTGEAIDFAGGGGSGSGSGNGDGENAPYESNEYVDGKGILRFSEEVTEVPDFFYDCKTLTSVTLPNSVTNIKDYAFKGCEFLETVVLPDSITGIYGEAFSGCSALNSINIPESVTTIGQSAFYGCSSLEKIIMPDGVVNIGEGAFSGCGRLASITIPEGITTINDNTFDYCSSLATITIPEGVTTIGNSAFQLCSGLTSVTIPESVTSIDSYAFNGCTSLKTVTIPKYVTIIGYSAFNECRDLVSITCLPVEYPNIQESTFSDTNNCPIYVPAESVDSYRSSNWWSAYVDRIQPIE